MKILRLWMLCLFILGVNAAVAGTTGVVFVHGKGAADMLDKKEAWSCWGTEMIAAVTKDFEIPYYVVGYDSRQNMAKVAPMVAEQVVRFMESKQVEHLVINTHSFGGIVMRYILSNLDEDPNYAQIAKATKWVNSLAGPHAGSETADLAESLSAPTITNWIVEWLGHNTESTWNLTTASMQYYNEHVLFGTENRPQLPVRFFSVAGNGVWNYWYRLQTEDLTLIMIAALTDFPSEHDALVTVRSAQAAGTPWFVSGANHHHIRRNDYEPIGTRLSTDFDHETLAPIKIEDSSSRSS